MFKKAHIPLDIKVAVWNKCSIYPLNKEITQCGTCDNLVLIPESIRQIYGITYHIKPIYINGKRKRISGVAEFGHILSEKNGGKATENNLIIQCKPCNTRLNSNNIESTYFSENCEMIDIVNESNIEMGENYETCQGVCSSGEKCKNKTIINRRFCHIHLLS